ncbi:5329_t:CDS:10 [Paraglomus occultum]|uniref:5329_t:CDS:1 n=1 Tax=Paraglomus occultum TaxID=144539 RepID=A0A9N9G0E6_9GLOM|nr:5329_t:CDS:10 [Paraglomus occultum]
MTDASPFSTQIIRGLSDKFYEKRKAVALDVEKLIREAAKEGDVAKIKAIINTLINEFAYSRNSNARNGGLIGLAAASIALGQDVAPYLDDIVMPVLHCFIDQDNRVRYYACESMYNIAKVAKGEILRYFNEVFDAMGKLAADSELSVKNGAELLDRLIKDIVAEQATTYVSSVDVPPMVKKEDSTMPAAMPRTKAFSLPKFIPLLAERIHAKNPFTRSFLVSWIAVLDSIPDLELVSYLPDFLEGLINLLSDSDRNLRHATSTVLANFLLEIREAVEVKEQQKREAMKKYYVEHQRKAANADTGDTEDGVLVWAGADKAINWDVVSVAETEDRGKGSGVWIPGQGVVIHFSRIIEILMPHLCSQEEGIQETALKWINEFIQLAKEVIVPFTPQLIRAVLPSLAHSAANIRSSAENVNSNLFKLIVEMPAAAYNTPITQNVLTKESHSSGKFASAVSLASSFMRSTSPSAEVSPMLSPILEKSPQALLPVDLGKSLSDPFDYQATVDALVHQFLDEHEETRVASLDWLLMLHKKAPHKILAIDDGTFPALLKTLSDPSEEVVKRDLRLLAQISSNSEDAYFTRFMIDLLQLFSTDKRLLESRGSLIIRQLCLSLNSERIYRCFAEILEKEEDLDFASTMVQNLNIILITAPELSELRKRLKNFDARDGQGLFTALYKSWCHNPVAVFSLCLLAQAYEHASNLLQSFGELDISVNLLIQIDKLVQLLESPVFTYLRLQLLEPEKYPHLFKCLYGVLMLLPQSSAFATLRSRLNSVSSMGFLHLVPKSSSSESKKHKESKASKEDGIKFQDLLSHFRTVQSKHEKIYKQVQIINRSSGSARRRGRDRERTASLNNNISNKSSGVLQLSGNSTTGVPAITSTTTETRRRTSDASTKSSRPQSPKRINHKK